MGFGIREAVEAYRRGKYHNAKYIEEMFRACEQNLRERPSVMNQLRLNDLYWNWGLIKGGWPSERTDK